MGGGGGPEEMLFFVGYAQRTTQCVVCADYIGNEPPLNLCWLVSQRLEGAG